MKPIKKYPPLIQNFIEIQTQNPDKIVATEVGSFFEIWQVEDIGHAKRVAQILDVVLTRKNKKDPDSPYMVGFPSHASENYFKRLVDAGEVVVVVEQSVRGKRAEANKNVSRSITRILSPGTSMDLREAKNNFFGSIYFENGLAGVCLLDVSTGEVKIQEMEDIAVQDFLEKNKPREILIIGDHKLKIKDEVVIHTQPRSKSITTTGAANESLTKLYNLKNPTSNNSYGIVSLGLELYKQGTLAFSNLINYFSMTEYNLNLLKKLGRPEVLTPEEKLMIPMNGYLSLEILEEISKGASLMVALDKCRTAMGRRKLKQSLINPLVDINEISSRHDKVQSFIEKKDFLEELKGVYDISRVARKMLLKNLMPHEIAQLYKSISNAKVVLDRLSISNSIESIIKYIDDRIDVGAAETYIDRDLYNFFRGDLSASIKYPREAMELAMDKMNLIKNQLSMDLETDKLRVVEKSDSFYLLGPRGVSAKAKEKGISFKDKTGDLQITDKKFMEASAKAFSARDAFGVAANRVWESFQLDFFDEFGEEINEICENVGEQDLLSSFAKISFERGYVRPTLVDSDQSFVSFKNLRHPVVEISNNLKEDFVSNSVELKNPKTTLVIYGANSSGKSTILKSLALNIIMAQIGCFVSAEEATLTTFDAILTRMTSFDSLSEGLSTFTMEMTELQVALKYSKKKTLFLFDEIGRGTSVEDGEAIAFGVLMHLDNSQNNCLTLFATHYHNLYNSISSIKNLEVKHLSCYMDKNNKMVFERKLKEGPGSGSYGIEVAKSCGLPEELIRLAQNYSRDINPVKISRYNKRVSGSTCPVCNINKVQETHHLVEQKQGQVKSYEIDGAKKDINNLKNLIMICGSCHNKITLGEIKVKVVKKLDSNEAVDIEVESE